MAVKEGIQNTMTEKCRSEKIVVHIYNTALYVSFQNVYAPDPDPEMNVIHYKRNFEQNEMLGLNDMKTENYEDDS